MSERFQIQDIVAQDNLGVQFHAIDTTTGNPVGLRRFFPFGRDGGGLVGQECDEYQRGVAEMSALHHPSLRAVLGGGCDPVDGYPYLVTEWVDGEPLSSLLQRGEFEPDAVVAVVDLALQLCEVISAKLGVEAMWLDTDPAMVVLDQESPHRGFTFGISPVRWLVDSRDRSSLLPIALMAESMMGWRGRLFGEQGAGGLGVWIKWIRDTVRTVSLGEARRSLADMTSGRTTAPGDIVRQETAAPGRAAAGGRPATRTGQLVPGPRATEPVALVRPGLKRKPKPLWMVAASLATLVVLVSWWVVKHPRSARASASPETAQTADAKRLAAVNARAAELAKRLADSDGIVFKAAETREILNEKDHTITVEGTVKRVRPSNSGATLYLEFGGDDQPDMVRGRVTVKDAGEDLSEAKLAKWVGKQVRITGMVKLVKLKDRSRPELLLETGGAIKEAP